MKCVSSIPHMVLLTGLGAGIAGCNSTMMTDTAAKTGDGVTALSRPMAFGWNSKAEPAPALRVPQPVPRRLNSGQAIALRQAVEMALSRHPDLGRAVAEIHRSRGDLTVAEAAWYPKASYTSTIGTDPGGSSSSVASAGRARMSAGLEVNQLVYDFGRADGQIAASRAVREQRDAELRDAEERVAMTTTEAHVELARAQRLLEATDAYLTALVNLRTTITLRASSGAANQADVFVADSRVQSAKAERIKSQTRYIAAQAKLYQLVGEQLSRAADPSAVMLTLARAVQAAPDDHATGVAAADRAAAAARARLVAAQASLHPAIGIKASQTFPIADKTITSTSLVGFSIQGDLFTGGASEGRIKAAAADAQSAERATALARLASATEAAVASAEITGASQRTQTHARQIDTARKARELSQAEYNIGKRTLTEVLNMEQEIFRAETDRINADGDGHLAIARAAWARGVLVQSLLQGGPAR